MILDAATIVLVVAGCAFFGAGTVGLLRFWDLNNRLHALVKADNLGLGLLLAGLALQAEPAVAVKLVLIWLLALLAAATSSFLLADQPQSGADSGVPASGSGTDGPNQTDGGTDGPIEADDGTDGPKQTGGGR